LKKGHSVDDKRSSLPKSVQDPEVRYIKEKFGICLETKA
jgi:hypothetical protein